eukprot:1160594-Pelagomonas_calceolata.AAC.5
MNLVLQGLQGLQGSSLQPKTLAVQLLSQVHCCPLLPGLLAAGSKLPYSGGASKSIINFVAVLEGHKNEVRSAAWSPAYESKLLRIQACLCCTGVQVAVLEGHENEVKSVAWSPDGSLVATCGRDKSVWIWESMPGNEYECVDVKQGHTQVSGSVPWSPDGSLIATLWRDQSL